MTLQRHALFWFGLLVLTILFLWIFGHILLPFILGMALAYLLDPLADRLERVGMNRLWATVTIISAAVVAIALLLTLLLPVLITQLVAFVERLPETISELQAFGNSILQSRLGQVLDLPEVRGPLEEFAGQAAGWIGTVLQQILVGGAAVVSFFSLLVVTPVVAFYLLYDWDRMIAAIDGWLPRQDVDTIRHLASEIDKTMSGFIRGQGAVCLILGLYYAIGLSLVGLNFGLLIGVVAGIISFIPYVGSITGFVVSIGVAIAQFWPDWPWVLVVAAVFLVGQFVEGNILQPKLVGSSVNVHPVWLIFALFAFGSLFGFVGLLMAVPITAAIGVIIRYGLGQYRDSDLYWGESRVAKRSNRFDDKSES